jgi:AcrR family transcriptional regulator
MPTTTTTTATDATKARLLEAAGQEFAEHGFGGATVRRICERAGANVAAVNYHFGDKESLYVQAVMEAHRCSIEPLPPDLTTGSPEAGLRRFIRHFLASVLAMDAQPSWHHPLILRELTRPTAACEALVREMIRPKFEVLMGLMRAMAPGAEERRLHALGFSVIGQCMHYRVGRPIAERLVGREGLEALDLDFLTDHIGGVVLAALGQGPPVVCGAPAANGHAGERSR